MPIWFCQYHLTHFIRTRIMQRERYDHSRAFFRSAGGSPPLAVQIVPEPSDKISSIIWVVLLRCSFLCLQILSYSLKSDIFLLSLAISSARQDIWVRMYISHRITLRTAIVFSVIYRCNAVQLFESVSCAMVQTLFSVSTRSFDARFSLYSTT